MSSTLLLVVSFVVLAPVVGGLFAGLDRIISARMQRRIGPPILQPFYDVGKLWKKTTVPVNPLVGPLLWGHVLFMALTGALLLANQDLLFTVFVFVLAAVCLVLAAGSTDSPYSSTGAQRELLLMLASEPFFILLAASVGKLTGATTLGGVLDSPIHVAASLPGLLAAFLLIVALKLRKSPFDVSASHHAHQELVRGMTSDLSGRHLALVEIAHWYESMILLGCLMTLFFNWNLALGFGVGVAFFLAAILLDNSTSRARWDLLVRTVWAVTLVLGGGNLVALSLAGW